jgi:hypothetical protein
MTTSEHQKFVRSMPEQKEQRSRRDLAPRCPMCGTPQSSTARFCGECETPMNGAVPIPETVRDSRRLTGPLVRLPRWAPPGAEQYPWTFNGEALSATAERLFPLAEKIPKCSWMDVIDAEEDLNAQFNQALAYVLFTDRRMESAWRELHERYQSEGTYDLLVLLISRAVMETDYFASGIHGEVFKEAQSVARCLNNIIKKLPNRAFFGEVLSALQYVVGYLNDGILSERRPSRPSLRTSVFMHLAWEILRQRYSLRMIRRDRKIERVLATVTEILVDSRAAEYSDENLHRLLTRPWSKGGTSANID